MNDTEECLLWEEKSFAEFFLDGSKDYRMRLHLVC